MKRVPIHTPSAPSVSAAASPRPSYRPPAATTGTCSPTASTTCGHERHRRHGAGVAAGLGALGDDEVAPAGDGGDGVADLAAHRADEDVGVVQRVDGLAGHAEAGDEDAGAALDDVVDALLDLPRHGREQVDAERLGGQLADLGHLVGQLVGAHRRGAERADAAGLADGGDEAVVGHPAHPGEHDRVLDVEQVGETGAHGRDGSGVHVGPTWCSMGDGHSST